MNKMIKIFQTVVAVGGCFFTLFLVSSSVLGMENSQSKESAVQVKSIMLTKTASGIISVPLQISPVQVEAPARRKDLIVGQARKSNRRVLSGFPVNLNDYPILNFVTNGVSSVFFGVNFELDSHAKGGADSLVHIGNPDLFPDMLDTRIDFHSVEFMPRGRIYSLMRKAGLGGDEKWRYTSQNVAVTGIANGVLSASFVSGSDLVLTKSFDSLNIEKAPWLNYEYTLPAGKSWAVQINAKINIDGLSRDVTLFSQPYIGEGKQKLLLNLKDLLYKKNSRATGARLKDLVIHFMLNPTSGGAKDVRIDFGRLDFYREQQPAQGDMPRRLLIVSNLSTPIDLVEKFDQLGVVGELDLLGGNWIGSGTEVENYSNALPEINFQASFREKVPQLFVGAASFLEDLSDSELNAVLDQNLFLEKNILWQKGQSEKLFLNQVAREGSNFGTLLLMKYALQVHVGDSSYVQVNYEFGGNEQFPVYLTLSGTDRKGREVSVDRILSNNTPVKIGELKLKRMMLSLRGESLATPLSSSFRIKNVQIGEVKKSNTFHQKKSTTNVLFDNGIHSTEFSPPTVSKIVWKAEAEIFDFGLHGNEELQIIKSFAINQRIVSNSFVRIDMAPSGAETFYLKVRGKSKNIWMEKLFPLSNFCSVRLPAMELQGIDLVVKSSSGSGTRQVRINKLAVEETSQKEIWAMPLQYRDVITLGSDEAKTVAAFKVDRKIFGGAVLDYELALSSGPALSYLLRIQGDNELGTFEWLMPLAMQGSLQLAEMNLRSLDLVIIGGDGALTSTVQLKRLSLRPRQTADQPKIQHLDASLTLKEIVSGQKLINLPPTVMDKGEHRFEYNASDDVDVRIDPAFIKLNQPQLSATDSKNGSQPADIKVRVYIGGLVAALLLYIAGRRFLPRWLPPELYSWFYKACFWIAAVALLLAAYYMAFKSGSKDAFSWGGMILVAAYGFAMRWKVRPLLAGKWSYFADRYSAPYFMMFLMLLIFCLALLMFKQDLVAGQLAVISYFLLIAGVVVEFAQFSKGASDKADA